MWAKKPDPEYKAEWFVVLGMVILGALVLFTAPNAKADYIYEGNQSLYDLQTNSSGATGLGSNDDSVSGAFDLGFTFTFYGNDFTQARMATNGCLHFNLTGSYCGDYTPDPLPQYTNTLFPFWTDLIKDNGSAMKAKAFNDYTIFGWYKMREFNRANSDNSIEVWLYPNNTYEFRYGELDIISHDVLIGEQGSTSQIYTYHFFDECNTGTTNVSGTCVSYDWNSSSNAMNTLLEDGGSLYGDGTNQSLCLTAPLTSVNCSGYAAAYLAQQCDIDSLYNNSCTGYAAAYLTQQCDINDLYSQSCPNYWSAYDDQQCDEDSQYSPSCQGYQQEESVAYYAEEDFDYGYAEEDMWYDEEYDEWLGSDDPCYENNCADFTDADWYELDIEQFGQEQVDEWYGNEVEFSDEGYIDYGSTSEEEYWTVIDDGMDVYDTEQEDIRVAEELAWEEEQQRHEEEMLQEELFLLEEETYIVELHDIEEEHIEYIEEFAVVDEFTTNQADVIDVLDAEELIELYEFDTIIREELDYEEEIFVIREEAEELEEEMEELREEEFMELEEEMEERLVEAEETEGSQESKRSSVRVNALSVVADTLRTARESVVDSEVSTLESVAVSVGNYTSNELFSNNFNTESTSSSTVANFNNPSSTSSVISFSGANYGSTTSASTASVSSSSVISSSSTGGGGISTSSSPSRSDQFASSSAQTQQVLSMSSVTVTDTVGSSGSSGSSGGSSSSSVSISITPMPTFDSTPQVVMADVQVTDMQGEINTAVGGVMTASEADQIADQIIADNIKEQQEAGQSTQEETGEYADQSTLVAFMGYVSGFDTYREARIPQQETWYEPKAIYADALIPDNIDAFYGLARTSINTMQSLINQQPNL